MCSECHTAMAALASAININKLEAQVSLYRSPDINKSS